MSLKESLVTVLRVFITILMVIFSLVSARASDCNEFLSAPALSNEIEAPLSEPARAYVRLVNYYLQHQQGVNAEDFLSSLISSEKLVNPFAGLKDTLSLALNDALKTFIAKITQQDWAQVTKALSEIAKDKRAERDDRQEKSDEVSRVLAPKIIFQDTYPSDVVMNVPNWHLVDNRIFAATSYDGKVFIYELIDEKVSKIDEVNVETEGVKVSWVSMQGRTFISMATGEGKIVLKELIANKFVSSGEIDLGSRIYAESDWKISGDNAYMTLSSQDALHLCRLTNGKLEYLNKVEIESMWSTDADWHEINGRLFVTLSTTPNNKSTHRFFNLFEVANNKLVFRDSKKAYRNMTLEIRLGLLSDVPVLMPSAYFAGGYLNYYTINHGKLKTQSLRVGMSSISLDESDINAYVINTINSKFSLLGWSNKKLNDIPSAEDIPFLEEVAVTGVVARHGLLIAIMDSNGLLVLKRFVNNLLITNISLEKIPFGNRVITSFIRKNDEVYLAVVNENKFMIYSLYPSLTKKPAQTQSVAP